MAKVNKILLLLGSIVFAVVFPWAMKLILFYSSGKSVPADTIWALFLVGILVPLVVIFLLLKKRKVKLIGGIACGVIFIVCMIISRPHTKSEEEYFKDSFDLYDRLAYVYLEEGDNVRLSKSLHALQDMLDVLNHYYNKSTTEAPEINASSEDIVLYLDAITNHKKNLAKRLDELYTQGRLASPDYYFEILEVFAKEKELTPSMKIHQKEMLVSLGNEKNFTGGFYDIEFIDKNKKLFKEIYSQKAPTAALASYVDLLVVAQTGGTYSTGTYIGKITNNKVGITASMLSQLGHLAEAYPDNILLQTIMVNSFRNWKIDSNATEVINLSKKALNNLSRLYKDNLEADYEYNHNFLYRNSLIQSHFLMLDYAGAYEEAADAYSKYADMPYSDVFANNMVYALYETGRYSECIRLAEEHKNIWETDFYSAMSSLKTGQYDACIEKAKSLSKYIMNNTNINNADTKLYRIAYELAYVKLSDAQLAKIKEDTLLYDYYQEGKLVYIDAVRNATAEQTAEAVRLTAELNSLKSGMAMPNYLLAIHYMQQFRYSDAVGLLEDVLDINPYEPYIWFHISECYHNMELYEESLESGVIAEMLCPWVQYYNENSYTDIGLWVTDEFALRTIREENEEYVKQAIESIEKNRKEDK